MEEQGLLGRKPSFIVRAVSPGGIIQPLYLVVKEREDPFASGYILFDQPHLAILWALISRDDILPKSRYTPGLKLDENNVSGRILIPEDIIPFVYPGYGTFRLYKYNFTEDFPLYLNPSLTDEELNSEEAIAIRAATAAMLTRGIPYLYGNIIVRDSKGNALFNRTMDRILKILEIYRPEEERILNELADYVLNPDGTLNKEAYETVMGSSEILNQNGIIGTVGSMNGFKLASGEILKLVDKEYINWEQAWLNFIVIRDYIDLNKMIPEWNLFVNSEIHYNVKGVTIDEDISVAVPQIRMNPGLCNANIRGFANHPQERTFCFMDSTLVAMFAFAGSPFTQKMIDEPLPRNIPPYCNTNDSSEDYRLRKEIQEELRSDYEILLTGKKHICSRLRYLLGKKCRRSNADEDMSTGIHDANELYERLMNALNYNPLTYRQLTEFSSTAEGREDDIEISQNNLVTSSMLPHIYAASGIEKISWPESWQSDFEFSQRRGARKFKRDSINILAADVIVFPLMRGIQQQQRSFVSQPFIPMQKITAPPIDIMNPFAGMKPQTQNSESTMPSTILQSLEQLKAMYAPPTPSTVPLTVPEKGKEELAAGGIEKERIEAQPKKETLEELHARLTGGPPKPSVPLRFLARPTAPHFQTNIPEVDVDDRRIVISHQFIVNGIQYNLRAVVYSVFAGHYGTLLNCEGAWFSYNDLDTEKAIAQRRIQTDNAEELINTRGVLFFYYPPAGQENFVKIKEVERRVLAEDQEQDIQRRAIMARDAERNKIEEQLEQQKSEEEEEIEQEEMRKALELSMMQNEQPQTSEDEGMIEEEEEEQINKPIQQEFLERWFAAEILVIGASYNQEDFNKWSGIDANYIGVGIVNPKLNDQVVTFTSGNPLGGVWNEDPVWETVLDLQKRTGKKFKTIWLELPAWEKLGARSGLGRELLATARTLLRNLGVNSFGEWIGTLNVPAEAVEFMASERGSPQLQRTVPLWVLLTEIGAYKTVSDDSIIILEDPHGQTMDYVMLAPVSAPETSQLQLKSRR